MFITESVELQLEDLLERICFNLQIHPSQHSEAEAHYTAIGNWLAAKDSPLARYEPSIYAQGSVRIGTTVRPLGRQEYDLDLVCELRADPRRIPRPAMLLDAVEARLRKNDIYRTRLERKNRCVRVRYANRFHLDILPACPDPSSGPGCVVVPDRAANDWKASNPKGYARWFESMAARYARAIEAAEMEPLPPAEPSDSKSPLKHVVQLLKRWRDIRYSQTPKVAPISIILTTLGAMHGNSRRSTAEAMTEVLEQIVLNIPDNGDRLVVLNPTNPKEDLSEKWSENRRAYDAFVYGITELRSQWTQIRKQQGIPDVSRLLEALFGKELAEQVFAEQARWIQEKRSKQELGVGRRLGIIGSATSAATTRTRPNTFYGE